MMEVKQENNIEDLFVCVQSSEILRRLAVEHRKVWADPEADHRGDELQAAELLESCANRLEEIDK